MDILSFINTPFKQKFGIPRQSLLVKSARGIMHFPKNDFFTEAFRGIESYSHLWLIFEFDQVGEENIKALVRPPRFAGEKRGVFATRSPHRPNRLGMSVVKFESLTFTEQHVILTVSGVDLLDGTPIVDIKPYLPYADIVSEARSREVSRPSSLEVCWSCEKVAESQLISEVLSFDPRPIHQKGEESYHMAIAGYDVEFRIIQDRVDILSVREI